ncbi:hypothetical protein [Mesorhizobium sp.]|uniref:hypothetical protein n=1 Tax=Mesorhizobium sp. TaxID=1871066 RepID=UPI00257CC3A2|nr:hypothetical protein [Mesorhizobium sp.]
MSAAVSGIAVANTNVLDSSFRKRQSLIAKGVVIAVFEEAWVAGVLISRERFDALACNEVRMGQRRRAL